MSEPFWCWTDGSPSTFRCRERGRDVRENSPGGLIPRAAWNDSQQDLAHVESQLRDAERERLQALAERDEEREKRDELIERYQRVCNDLFDAEKERDQLRVLYSSLVSEVNRLGADVASARGKLDRLSEWHSLSTHEEEIGLCAGCGERYPCHARLILDSKEK